MAEPYLSSSRQRRIEAWRETLSASESRSTPALANAAPALPPTSEHPPAPPFFPQPDGTPRAVARHTALSSSLAPKTLSGYVSTVKRFWEFCNASGIPLDDRFPATSNTLFDFAASFVGSKSGATAANALSALHAWHNAHDLPWNTTPCLQMIIKGVSNKAPAASKKLPRPPATIKMLQTLYSELDLTAPLDAAVFAAATVAFWGQCRLGELLGTSRLRHDPSAHPSRSALQKPPSVGVSVALSLPRTKTSGVSGELINIPHQRGHADPSFALTNHLKINAGVDESNHLFAFLNMHGEPRCLTKEVFLNRCNKIWGAAGLPRLTGHSFRIGGTNAYLDAGVPTDIVRVKGRWKSDAYFVYWRNQDRLQASHTVRIKTGGITRSHTDRSLQG